MYEKFFSSFWIKFFSFSWIKNLLGFYVYIAFSTFFVVILFLVQYFKNFSFFKSKASILFVLTFIFNLLFISIFAESGYRFDQHFYGRYLEAFLLPVLLLSFDYIFNLKTKISHKTILFVLVFLLISLFFMYRFEDFVITHSYNMFPFIVFFENFGLYSFCFLVVFYLFFSLFFCFSSFRYRLAFFILVSIISIGGFFSYFFRYSESLFLEAQIPVYLNKIGKTFSPVYFSGDESEMYLNAVYSYHFPNFRGKFDKSNLCLFRKGFLIASKNLDCKDAYLLTYENHKDFALYTFDKTLYEELSIKNRVVKEEMPDFALVKPEISVVFDFSFGRTRVLKFFVKNVGSIPWVTYYPSRHSFFEEHPFSLREYCFKGDEIVWEKRRRFDSVLFPGESQSFFFYTVSPVCSKITYDVVQEGYTGFEPVLEINLK
jgi:hypothetical protein